MAVTVDETDEELRARIAEAYGRWGAFLSHVIESHGEALDECAAHVNLRRIRADDLRDDPRGAG